MKTKTWILLFALLLVLCLGLSVFLLLPGDAAAFAQITSDGTVIKTVDLRIDQEFTVTAPGGGTNTITVRDGKVGVTASDCPGEDCVHSGFVGNSGRSIVCLPNRLEIRIVSAPGDVDFIVG